MTYLTPNLILNTKQIYKKSLILYNTYILPLSIFHPYFFSTTPKHLQTKISNIILT